MPGSYQGNDPIYFDSISLITAVQQVPLGSERWESGAKYVYVQAATAVSQGKAAMPYTAWKIQNFADTATISFCAFAGLVQHASFVTDEYGWLLVHGAGNVASATTALSAAGRTFGFTDGGKLGNITETGTVHVNGFFNSASSATSDASAAVFIKSDVF